jgi:hypothetical protein
MYPTTPVGGLDHLLAITVIAIAWTDIALAGLAYHHDVASTVRARSIVQPWVISIAAFGLSFVPIMVSRGDGLIIAYVLSMVAALIAALIPLLRCYGLPHGLGYGGPQRPARCGGHRRVGLAANRPRSSGCIPSGKLCRHLLCRAAGRDPARQAQDQLRA